jgi:hypothetical protein
MAALGVGCGRETPTEYLGLVELFPESGAEPISLNDDLRIIFDRVIEPTSITSSSVRLVNKKSRRSAEGHWLIQGRELRFQPLGALRRDLRDGGFQPGSEYVLTVDGFPLLSGPRSLRGEGLRHPIQHTFRTRSWDAEDVGPRREGSSEASTLLRDASPDAAALLHLRPDDPGASETTPLAWDAHLILACDEPLDPRWFRPEDFEIRPRKSPRIRRSPIPEPTDAQVKSVQVASISLLHNEDEDVSAGSEGPGAVLRVTFAERLPLRDGSRGAFELVLKQGVRDGGGVCDFSGHPAYRLPIPFFAVRRDAFTPERKGSYEFEFLDAQDFTPLLDPASDGTALWSDTGRLEVRYPRAAGDGSAGRVTLDGAFAGGDLHGTRVTVPVDSEARLTGGGLVVLRSQGRIDIDGRLVRSLAEGQSPEAIWDPKAMETSGSTETLTNWLAGARIKDAPWTVIVAGGDLVVRGKIDVETPLLLVAGGMIRGVGAPGAARNQVWLLGAGGFESMPHSSDATASPNVTPPLMIDEPTFNQLVEPLSFVAVSSEVPKGVAPTDWGSPSILGTGGSAGTFRVHFLKPAPRGDDASPQGTRPGGSRWGEEWLRQAVRHDEPMDVLLEGGQVDEGGGRVRLWTELRLLPAPVPRNPGPWDPPFVDRVRLFWTPNPR